MRKRRPAGDGMIRKRTDGRWEGRIVVGKKNDGTPLFKSVLAPTQKELIPKLHSLLETYKDVELTEDSRMPLSKWLNRWLDDFIADAIRPSTMRSYRGLLERHVVPVLGDKSLHNITTDDVQKLYNSLGEGGKNLSSSTVRGVHMVLHQALDAAVQQNMMVFNPTEGATIPKLRQPEMQVLNAEQLEIFKEAIKNEPSWYDFFQTEITTGLRRGEICGLRWSDFDPRRGILQVNRTLTVEPGGEVRVGEPKTENGKRSILLPKSTADLLRMRKRNSISDWIFPNLLKPEKPMHPGRPYRKLKQILKEADLPQIRFHDLRHTFATHALASGVDAKTLSEILGHAKASFTLDTYTHVTGDMQRNAAAVVEQFMDNLFGEEMMLL